MAVVGFGCAFVGYGGFEWCVFASDGSVELELGWRWWLGVPPHPILLPRLRFVSETDVEFRGEESLRNVAVVSSKLRVRWLVMWRLRSRNDRVDVMFLARPDRACAFWTWGGCATPGCAV